MRLALITAIVYEKYLDPIRDQPLKMLEIGLGCNMEYGPGHSYYTWLEFLPNVDLYYIEYDKDCVEKWSQVCFSLNQSVKVGKLIRDIEHDKRQNLHR